MKEDYLWNKTGSDLEIEELENSLKEFRSTNTIAPQLPQKTFAFNKDSLQDEPPRRFSFRFAFAAFACLAFAIISVGLFQVFNSGEQDIAKNKFQGILGEPKFEKPLVVGSKPVEIETIEEVKKESTQPTHVKAKVIAKPKPKVKEKRSVVKVEKHVQPKVKSIPTIAKTIEPKPINNEPKVKIVKLTKEEKEAYEMLLQALAVTGSQMRIVQEGINGVEEKPVVKKGKR